MTGARRHIPLGTALVLVLCVTLPRPAPAQSAAAASDPAARDVKQFCTNVAEAARDRRYLIQKKELETLKVGIAKRMKQLDAKRAEYEDWLTRRNNFLKVAQAKLVGIYTKMDADAAASQLQLMNPDIAAAILMKLKPAQASAIFNQMKADKAALLAGIIASAGDPNTSRNPS